MVSNKTLVLAGGGDGRIRSRGSLATVICATSFSNGGAAAIVKQWGQRCGGEVDDAGWAGSAVRLA